MAASSSPRFVISAFPWFFSAVLFGTVHAVQVDGSLDLFAGLITFIAGLFFG